MKVLSFVTPWLILLFVSICAANAEGQTKNIPPLATGTSTEASAQNIEHLTPPEEIEILRLQRDIGDAETKAFQYKSMLDDQNKVIQDRAAALNAKIDSLREIHKLPKQTFFNGEKAYFVKAPAPTEKK